MNITFDDLIRKIEMYNPDEVEIIKKAYICADTFHNGQLRESGEPYIIHPLNVAYILADMKADRDTVCAGLLHDTIEDTNLTKEDITHEFNSNIAELVDGVTKLAKMDYDSKESLNYANTRKIVSSITKDARIAIIKLADRLHNMRTLQFKPVAKQRENALETLEIFVPIAYYLGAYNIKTELEDLSLKYLYLDSYSRISDQKTLFEEENFDCLIKMYETLRESLNAKKIPNEIKVRYMNIYSIYKRLNENKVNDIHDLVKIEDTHDLLQLKVLVDTKDNCYVAMGAVHDAYHPLFATFRDYISIPKTNMYQSIHSTVFAPDDRLVQTQIRTRDMDNIAMYGLTAYWDINKGQAGKRMQEDLQKDGQIINPIKEISRISTDNKEFVERIKWELFGEKIYVYNTKGIPVMLPVGSTAIDFAYEQGTELGNNISSVEINGVESAPETVLHDKEICKVITKKEPTGPKIEWLNCVKTSHAKRKIKEFNGNL